jgi:hypothetical protein
VRGAKGGRWIGIITLHINCELQTGKYLFDKLVLHAGTSLDKGAADNDKTAQHVCVDPTLLLLEVLARFDPVFVLELFDLEAGLGLNSAGVADGLGDVAELWGGGKSNLVYSPRINRIIS